jgi:hypothetical protein
MEKKEILFRDGKPYYEVESKHTDTTGFNDPKPVSQPRPEPQPEPRTKLPGEPLDYTETWNGKARQMRTACLPADFAQIYLTADIDQVSVNGKSLQDAIDSQLVFAEDGNFYREDGSTYNLRIAIRNHKARIDIKPKCKCKKENTNNG